MHISSENLLVKKYGTHTLDSVQELALALDLRNVVACNYVGHVMIQHISSILDLTKLLHNTPFLFLT